MATKVNRKEAVVRIECELPFVLSTGSLRGDNYVVDGIRQYVVHSYAEPIARVTYSEDYDDNNDVVTTRNVWVTDKKFSVTTSIHTGIARRGLKVTTK
jgi:hypothetical protein